MRQSASSRPEPASVLAGATRLAIFLLPAAVLLIGALRARLLTDQPHLLLGIGTLCQLALSAFLVMRREWRHPSWALLLILYLIALAWLWVDGIESRDWYIRLGQAVLLVGSMTIFAVQVLFESGAPEFRRARLLAQRLGERHDWPADLAACRDMPEVKAFREALHRDASPALALLLRPQAEVRVAALAAMEFRKDWRKGQAELVMDLARRSPEPPVRAAAVNCLANLEGRVLVEQLAELLDDASWEVRRATAAALLWDTARRWPWIRHAVRRTLANPAHQDDGPLLQHRQLLPPEAVNDLTAWAGEKGILGQRAARTLALHYERALKEQPDEGLINSLRRVLVDPHAPPSLRMELAQLMQGNHLLDRPFQEKLLDPVNPAPLRLLAAEALLGSSGEHLEAVAALRDVARLPNREIALATASVVQRRLGVDLGLAVGQALPAVNTRKAAEVTRRVMLWASQEIVAKVGSATPTRV